MPDFLGVKSKWVTVGADTGNSQSYPLHITTSCPRPSPMGLHTEGIANNQSTSPCSVQTTHTSMGDLKFGEALKSKCLPGAWPCKALWHGWVRAAGTSKQEEVGTPEEWSKAALGMHSELRESKTHAPVAQGQNLSKAVLL